MIRTIKTIIIGENIEKIPENALPGAPADLVVKSVFEERPSDWNANFTNAAVQYGYQADEVNEKPIFDTTPLKDEQGNILVKWNYTSYGEDDNYVLSAKYVYFY